jgi:hypothetical protein
MHLGSFVNENSIWYTSLSVCSFKLFCMASTAELRRINVISQASIS